MRPCIKSAGAGLPRACAPRVQPRKRITTPRSINQSAHCQNTIAIRVPEPNCLIAHHEFLSRPRLLPEPLLLRSKLPAIPAIALDAVATALTQ